MLFVIFVFTSIIGWTQDEPDLLKEGHFHEVYKTYNAEPTPYDSWSQVTTGKDQSYEIRSGDTLWEISDVLFGDSYFWPKVWSLNVSEIGNPHEIEPNQVLTFTQGTKDQAPKMQLSESAPEPVRSKKRSAPPPKIPPSLPHWIYEKPEYARKDSEIILNPRNQYVPEANQILSSFVSNVPLSEIGEVVEVERGFGSAMEFQIVFVKATSGAVGRQYSVMKEDTTLKDPDYEVKGTVIVVEGLIKLTELVDPAEQIFRAVVIRSTDKLSKGAKLVDKPLPVWQIGGATLAGIARSRVVGGQFALRRSVLGTSSVVYLGGGQSAGLAKGRIYEVFKNQKLRNPSTLAAKDSQKIAKVLIIDSNENFATGYVLNSSQEISEGDVLDPSLL